MPIQKEKLWLLTRLSATGVHMLEDNGGSFAKVNIAWFNWWLKDDLGATGKGMFAGTNCGLCSDSSWTLKPKNIQ